MGDYADGTRVVYAMSGTTPLACAEVPAVAHGMERQYVVDDELLNNMVAILGSVRGFDKIAFHFWFLKEIPFNQAPVLRW